MYLECSSKIDIIFLCHSLPENLIDLFGIVIDS